MDSMSVHVLRLGHRPSRDKRVSTHLLLAARTFGASGGIYTGDKDPSLEESIQNVVSEWGGEFSLEYSDSWRKSIKSWKGKIVHLTMYGLPFKEVIEEIREDPSDLLVVVGGAKVPGEVYGLVDWNVGVSDQPHSEVSALGVFLYELFDRELVDFVDGRLKVVPQAHGKLVEERSREDLSPAKENVLE